MAQLAMRTLEVRFRDQGSAKSTKGEFVLHGQDKQVLALHLPWRYVIKPGSTIFLMSSSAKTGLPEQVVHVVRPTIRRVKAKLQTNHGMV